MAISPEIGQVLIFLEQLFASIERENEHVFTESLLLKEYSLDGLLSLLRLIHEVFTCLVTQFTAENTIREAKICNYIQDALIHQICTLFEVFTLGVHHIRV